MELPTLVDILIQPRAVVGLTGHDVPPAEAAYDRQQAGLASRLDSKAVSTKVGVADLSRRLKGVSVCPNEL